MFPLEDKTLALVYIVKKQKRRGCGGGDGGGGGGGGSSLCLRLSNQQVAMGVLSYKG